MLKELNYLMPGLLLKPRYRALRHSIIILSVLLISVNVMWDEPTEILAERFGIWMVYFLTFIIVIYANMYGLVPTLLLKGRSQKYLLFLLGLLFFFLLSVGVLQSLADDGSGVSSRTPVVIAFTAGLSTFILFIAGLTTLQFFKYSMINQQKIKELENATMEVELANLQNQINPHFLFNMLNNANIMALENSRISSDILSKLSELLVYQVQRSSEKSVRLEEEILFLSDYLKLEKLRRDRFRFSINSATQLQIIIPPLLFIPFVENAVKHNPENDAFVEITFLNEGRKLRFECKNNKAKLAVTKKEGGIGLPNVRKRLELLFPEKHRLLINDNSEVFTVMMEIDL